MTLTLSLHDLIRHPSARFGLGGSGAPDGQPLQRGQLIAPDQQAKQGGHGGFSRA